MKTYIIVIIVLLGCLLLYVGCTLVVNATLNCIGNIRKNEYNKGYGKGYNKGFQIGLVQGREEAERLEKVVDITSRATVQEIREAFGLERSKSLDSLRDAGIITQNEYEKEMEEAWKVKNEG